MSYFVGQKSCSLQQPLVPESWQKSWKLKRCYSLNAASSYTDWKAEESDGVLYGWEVTHHHQRNEEKGGKEGGLQKLPINQE